MRRIRPLLNFVLGSSVALSALALPAPLHGQEEETRLWKDASGKFQIRARMVDHGPQGVRLHSADGREIVVPVERLSPADQAYLKSLDMPADDPFAGGRPLKPAGDEPNPEPHSDADAGGFRSLPPSDSAGDLLALPDTGKAIDANSAAEESYQPDAMSTPPSPPAGVVTVSDVDAYDKVSSPVAADGAGNQYLVSIGRNKSGSPQETRGRIFAVDLQSKQSKLVWDFPRAVRVLGHDAASGRTLIIDGLDQFQRGGELVIVEGLADGEHRALFRRTLPGAGKPGFAPQIQWARMLSGSHIAAILDGTLMVWDLPAAQLVYKVEKVTASESPALSGHELTMAIPQSNQVLLVETVSGKILKKIPTGTTLNPGVAFDSAGRSLAICFSNQYLIWDCVEDRVLHQATTTDHLASAPVNWIGSKAFLSAMGTLVQLDLGMGVWNYSIPPGAERSIQGGNLLLATSLQKCELVSVGIPHPAAAQSVRELMRAGDAAMLVRQGTAVSIAVEAMAGVDPGPIRQALADAAREALWEVSDRAAITLVAKIGRGETQQLHFRSLGGEARTESTATLTPFTADLEIRRGADVLWHRSTVNHIPSLLRLEEGETVQDAVRRYEKPNAQFFSLVDLPPRIPKPEAAAGIGRSTLQDGQWVDAKPSGGPSGRRSGPRGPRGR